MRRVAKTTAKNLAQAKIWVEAWKRAAPELERMRCEEIRRADTESAIPVFDGLFESAIEANPPGPMCGLVEQQRLFGRLRR
jgi:hypothetical protein